MEAGTHSGTLYQMEYKFDFRWWKFFRPQVGVDTCDFENLLIYGGIGIDVPIYCNFFATISFSPGIYFKGTGRDLGHPIEFRSAFDLYYIFKGIFRVGGQIFHVSNASLSCRNPGMNGYLLYFGISH